MRKISKSYGVIIESSAATLINLVNKGLRVRIVYMYVYIYTCVIAVHCWSLSTPTAIETDRTCLHALDWNFKSEKLGTHAGSDAEAQETYSRPLMECFVQRCRCHHMEQHYT